MPEIYLLSCLRRPSLLRTAVRQSVVRIHHNSSVSSLVDEHLCCLQAFYYHNATTSTPGQPSRCTCVSRSGGEPTGEPWPVLGWLSHGAPPPLSTQAVAGAGWTLHFQAGLEVLEQPCPSTHWGTQTVSLFLPWYEKGWVAHSRDAPRRGPVGRVFLLPSHPFRHLDLTCFLTCSNLVVGRCILLFCFNEQINTS